MDTGRRRLDEPAFNTAANEHGAADSLEDGEDDHKIKDTTKRPPCASPDSSAKLRPAWLRRFFSAARVARTLASGLDFAPNVARRSS